MLSRYGGEEFAVAELKPDDGLAHGGLPGRPGLLSALSKGPVLHALPGRTFSSSVFVRSTALRVAAAYPSASIRRSEQFELERPGVAGCQHRVDKRVDAEIPVAGHGAVARRGRLRGVDNGIADLHDRDQGARPAQRGREVVLRPAVAEVHDEPDPGLLGDPDPVPHGVDEGPVGAQRRLDRQPDAPGLGVGDARSDRLGKGCRELRHRAAVTRSRCEVGAAADLGGEVDETVDALARRIPAGRRGHLLQRPLQQDGIITGYPLLRLSMLLERGRRCFCGWFGRWPVTAPSAARGCGARRRPLVRMSADADAVNGRDDNRGEDCDYRSDREAE